MGPYDSAYSAPAHTNLADSILFPTGNIFADIGLFAGAESLLLTAGGQNINKGIFAPEATRGPFKSFRGAIGRRIAPMELMGNLRARGAAASQYFDKGGTFKQFRLLKDARTGSGIFKGARGSMYERLARSFGSKNASKLLLSSTLKAGFTGLFALSLFGFGKDLGRGAADVVADYRQVRDMDIQLESGGFFADTRGSFTQRQRAIRAIHNSQLSTRSALMQEASFMHI